MKKSIQIRLLCVGVFLSVFGLVGCDLLAYYASPEIHVTPWPSAELQTPIDLSQFPPFDLPKDDHVGVIVASEWISPNAHVTIETVDYETWDSVSEKIIFDHRLVSDDRLRFSPNGYLWGKEVETPPYSKTGFGSLSVFDSAGKRIKKIHHQCEGDELLFYEQKAYYTCWGKARIFVVDVETLTAVTAIELGEEMFKIGNLEVSDGRLIATVSKHPDGDSHLVQVDLTTGEVFSISEPHDGWVREKRDRDGNVYETEIEENAYFLMESNLLTGETTQWELSTASPCFDTFFTYDQETYVVAALPLEMLVLTPLSLLELSLLEPFTADDPRWHYLCPREWAHGVFRFDRQAGMFDLVWKMPHNAGGISFFDAYGSDN